MEGGTRVFRWSDGFAVSGREAGYASFSMSSDAIGV